MFKPEIYTKRRKVLAEKIGAGIILILGNDESPMNFADNTYSFRQDSSFLYYFGINLPGLAGIIDIDHDREMIFGDDYTINDIVWTGPKETIANWAAKSGINESQPMVKLYTVLKEAQASRKDIHFLPPYRPGNKIKLLRLLNIRPDQVNVKASTDLAKAVISQREIKSEEEIVEIENAVTLSTNMHIEAIKMTAPGMRESQIVAKIQAMVTAENQELAYPIIATKNGHILHNHCHGNIIEKGDLFLLDAGASSKRYYAGDISSTFPVDKKFTSEQKEIYEVSLRAHEAAINKLDTDVPFIDIHFEACKSIVDSLKYIGFLNGDTEEIIEEGAHALFFPTGIGHMLGLDVHDMEDLGESLVGYDGESKSPQFGLNALRLAKPLKVGHVFTIEPGIYFIPELIDKWKAKKKYDSFINWNKVERYRNFGGIRNEENFIITKNGAKRLGKRKPLTIADIENLRS